MSHSHAKVTGAFPSAPRRLWLEVIFGLAFFGLAAVATLFITTDRESNHDFFTSTGTILESRIVVDSMRESGFGGAILYRIEAHVTYDLDGRQQDRWLPASEVTTARPLLAARLASNPKTCMVYWRPNHPENARCQLKNAFGPVHVNR
jgi:hypothetical protein